MEREAKLVLVLVLLPLFATITAVELQKCVCAWSLHEFAFTLGYGITLKIAKFFAFGCLVHKARCHVPAVR